MVRGVVRVLTTIFQDLDPSPTLLKKEDKDETREGQERRGSGRSGEGGWVMGRGERSRWEGWLRGRGGRRGRRPGEEG